MDQTTTAPVAEITPETPTRFINRELSWLDFNFRVVAEAENPHHPLLERLRFVSISASNLDEFYSVRVAGLIGQARAGFLERSPDGLTAAQQLTAINTRSHALIAAQQAAFTNLKGLLAEAGISICTPLSLSSDDAQFLDSYFMERVFPILTPLAIDDADTVPQETALLHLLNAAAEAGHPVLLTAREPPSRQTHLLPDLASRLRASLAVEISPPDDAMLTQLLFRLAAARQLILNAQVSQFLLTQLPRTPAALREAIARLDRAALAAGGKITRPLAAQILTDLISP